MHFPRSVRLAVIEPVYAEGVVFLSLGSRVCERTLGFEAIARVTPKALHKLTHRWHLSLEQFRQCWANLDDVFFFTLLLIIQTEQESILLSSSAASLEFLAAAAGTGIVPANFLAAPNSGRKLRWL